MTPAGPAEGQLLGVGAFALLVALFTWGGASTVLFLWARAVARKHDTPVWRALRWVPVAATPVGALGMVGTVVGLVRAFGAVADADPAKKAEILAEGISAAMNATVLGTGLGGLLLGVSVVASTVGSIRPARASSPAS